MRELGNGTVEITNLFKYFGEEKAVNDVSLTVAEGEFVTLLGPLGCGKTTTLRCIAGLERPTGGEIGIGGEIVASTDLGIYLDPEDRNIGMVFQSYAVWPHMTLFDNVAYGLQVRRTSASDIKTRTNRVLELVGLAPLADRYATKLSGGQRQCAVQSLVAEVGPTLLDPPCGDEIGLVHRGQRSAAPPAGVATKGGRYRALHLVIWAVLRSVMLADRALRIASSA